MSRKLLALMALALFTSMCIPIYGTEIILPLQYTVVDPKNPNALIRVPRTAYQTNEVIDVAVVRSAAAAIPAGELGLTLTDGTGGSIAIKFAVDAVQVQGNDARRTEHLHLNAALLRPGHYTMEAACDGAKAAAEFDVVSHIRKSSFRIVRWGMGRGDGLSLGEDSQGFNTNYGEYRNNEHLDDTVLGGVDFMQLCTMGGGHQMAMRIECDWSDPYVMGGGSAMLVRQAMLNRIYGNCLGVHMYDEPGLTWVGDWIGTHTVPSELRSFESSFNQARINAKELKPDDPAQLAAWQQWGHWKLSFIEAAWKLCRWGVESVNPDLLAVNQHMYGMPAYSDGYYWNVGRALRVLNGHGGYDGGSGYYSLWHFESSLPRQHDRPAWYMPTFDGGLRPTQCRLEHYLAFMHGAQGIMVPFWQNYPSGITSMDGLVESNKLLQKIGPITTTMPYTRPQVALLWSMSQNLYAQSRDMKDNYTGGGHRFGVMITYYASKYAQMPMDPIVDEDVLDGTVAANHKVVVIPTADYLDPKVVAGLEAFIAAGGKVLLGNDCRVQIKGAEKGLPVDGRNSPWAVFQKSFDEGHPAWDTFKGNAGYKAIAPVAAALKEKLPKMGIKPLVECDNPNIYAWRQAAGDIEYIFLANATGDPDLPGEMIKTTALKVGLSDDGRPIYDAANGGPAREWKGGKALLRFGTGQMKVYARTARPVGGVEVFTPIVRRDLTSRKQPVTVEVSAALVDGKGHVLSGSAPMEIRVIDPNGATRHHLYRATDQGTVKIGVPLGANDPAGTWRVAVKELLTNQEGQAAFAYAIGAQCQAMTGATGRAAHFGNDREKIFAFFRTFRDVTVVTGAGPYNAPAAERVARILKPWDVQCRIVPAADVKARELTADEAPTWAGMNGGYDRMKPGPGARPDQTGFAIRGAAILLGTPEDNPLIKFAADGGFLPYKPGPDFPGRGRGMMAWSRDNVSFGNECVVLIGYDADGLNEAIGTMYEAAAGLEPLMAWNTPGQAAVVPGKAQVLPEAATEWEVLLPDHVAAMKPLGGRKAVAVSNDGTVACIDSGKVVWKQEVNGGERFFLDATPDGSTVAVGAWNHVACFNAAGKELFDVPVTADAANPEGFKGTPVTAIALSPDGKAVAVAAKDGKLMVLSAKGGVVWRTGGLTKQEMDAWNAAMKTWQDGKPARDAALKVYQEGPLAAWQKAVQDWEKADPNTRGEKPKQPESPPNPPAPAIADKQPYLALAFSADGKALAALAAQVMRVINSADGKTVQEIPGTAPVPPLVTPKGFVIIYGKALARFDLAENKLTASMEFPQPGLVPALAGGQLLVGSEVEYTVRKIKDLVPGKLAEQTAWQHTLRGRFPKRIAAIADKTAVAWWGGTLEILGPDGKAALKRIFPADITDLAWVGESKLIAAFSDGKVIGLSIK